MPCSSPNVKSLGEGLEFEGLMSDLADNRVAAEALGANAHRLRRAVGERDANVLKVR